MFHRKGFKPVVAIAMGLAGFVVSWHAQQLYEADALTVNFLPGLVFPLLVALAWGWRWALVSALAGGTQWVWWLWSEDGWGTVYSFAIFTLWVVWHGWWAEHKRTTNRWYFSPFAVEAPFRVVSEVGFVTLFVWLVSQNPPPWNPEATITSVPWDWILVSEGKHVIEGYLLVLVAYTALGLGPIRKFFGLARKPSQRDLTTIFSVGILVVVGLWFAYNVAHYYAQQGVAKNLWDALVFHPTGASLVTRILFMAVLLGGTAAFARFTQQRAKLQTTLDHQNRVLLAIRNVNLLITRERNRQQLLDQACKLLVETRGYQNVWIALLDVPLDRGTPLPESFHVTAWHRAGSDDDSQAPMHASLASGQVPSCVRAAFKVPDVLVLQNPASECRDCVFACHDQGHAGLVVRLESGGRIHGWVNASIPPHCTDDPLERALMREISDDLAFAIESIHTGESLEETRRREEAAVRAGRVGLWDWDLATGRVFYSTEWKRHLGFRDDEIGDTLDEWESRVHPDDLPPTMAAIRSHIEHCAEGYSVEYRLRHKDGSYRWILSQASVMSSPDGHAIRVMGTHVDVTDIKRMNHELLETTRQAEAASRAKSMFLATMSHELRTPLTPILGFSELLLDDANLTPEQQEAIKTIHQRGNDLLLLISDLLDFSMIDADIIRMNPQFLDVRTVVEEAVALFAEAAANKGISITTALGPNLAQPLLLDPSRMRQILLNLLGNAVKFTESGEIHLAANVEEGSLLLSVADTGPGIAEKDLKKIFDVFFQADSSMTRKHGGAGLGLPICKRIVAAMGGEIRVESTPGKGSTFHVSIPDSPAPPANQDHSSRPKTL